MNSYLGDEGVVIMNRSRVGIYNRCSTEEEAQVYALETQVAESREIAEQMGWVITGHYIESESGTSTRKRLEYQRLLEDMEKDVFDIIMIKSIDRLMRATKDWYLFIDKVVTCGLKLYIYIDQKFYDADDALITGIKAILAEDFSRELSKKIKNAHKRRQEKRSGYNITSELFGWDKINTKEFKINEEEAKYYRIAFAMAYEGIGLHTISNYMYAQGVLSKTTGKKISATQWRKMLYSPKAHGTVILHQTEYDFNTKKRCKIPEKDWIMIENALPAIVSKEYQESVIMEIKKRNRKQKEKHKGGNHVLSGKLQCACCGSIYYRNVFEERTIWRCSTKMDRGISVCNNINVYENTVIDIVEQACRNYYEKIVEVDKVDILEKTICIVKKVILENQEEQILKKVEKELKVQERKKEVLFDRLMDEVIDINDFHLFHNKLSQKIEELKANIEKIKATESSLSDRQKRLKEIRDALYNGSLLLKAEARIVFHQIDKILVYPDKQMEVQLNIEKIKRSSTKKTESMEVEDGSMLYMKLPYIHKNKYKREQEELDKKVYELIKHNPSIMLKDMTGIMDESYYRISQAAKRLRAAGIITMQRHGDGKTSWHLKDE